MIELLLKNLKFNFKETDESFMKKIKRKNCKIQRHEKKQDLEL